MPTVETGEELFAQERYEEARACFMAVVAQSPDNAEAFNDLGVVSLTMGNFTEAETYFLKALALAPAYLEARSNLVDLYLQINVPDQALPHLQGLVQQDPDNVPLVNQLAGLYRRLGKYTELSKLVQSSNYLRLIGEFVDTLWLNMGYWEKIEDVSLRARLEGVVLSLLSGLEDSRHPEIKYRIAAQNQDTGELGWLDDLTDVFNLKKSASQELQTIKPTDEKDAPLVLTKENPDWQRFRILLHTEMSDEGGCLGDYTHAKKILKRNGTLQKYHLASTLDYFRENFGPCDCHVLRSIQI